MDCPIGCGFDLGLLLLSIGVLLLGLVLLLSVALNIGGIMMLLRRFKVRLDIEAREAAADAKGKTGHSAAALWLFAAFIAVLAAWLILAIGF